LIFLNLGLTSKCTW